jgi:hypothetical protein
MCQAEEKLALEKYKAAAKKSSSSTAKKPSVTSKSSSNAWSTAAGSKNKSMNLSMIGRSSAPKASNSFASLGDDSDDD